MENMAALQLCNGLAIILSEVLQAYNTAFLHFLVIWIVLLLVSIDHCVHGRESLLKLLILLLDTLTPTYKA